MSKEVVDWPRVPVSAVARLIVGGGTPSRDVPSFWNGGIPWVTPGELTKLRGKWLRTTEETITSSGLAKSGARMLPANTLVVTTRATLGASALTAGPMTTNQGFKSIVFSTKADPHFFYHFFNMMKPEMERRASGTTFLEISGKEFGRLSVPLPPLPQQRRIAEILDTLDDQIGSIDAIVDKRIKFHEGLLLNMFDSDPGSLAKQGSTHAPLGDMVSRGRPIVYGILMPGKDHPGGVPVVKVRDMKSGVIDRSTLLRTSPSIDRAYRRSRLMPSDVLLSIRGTVGRVCTVPENLAGANITQDTARISVPTLLSGYVAHFLGSPAAQRFIDSEVVGLAVRGINLRDVRRIKIPLLPETEMRMIERVLDASQMSINCEREKAEKVRGIRQGLMSDLLTGRVRAAQATAP